MKARPPTSRRAKPRGAGALQGSLSALVLQGAARWPGAVAVKAGDVTLSFGDLARQAAAVTAGLRGMGVTPGDRVGIFLDRRPALVSAMLGVMEAGAAFVPLDPTYPPARLALMAEDARLAAILTDAAGAADAPAGAPVVCLEAWLAEGAPAPAAPPQGEGAGGGEALAYVMYTSGSTGRPKGVEIPHRAAVSLCHAMADLLALGPGDRVVQYTSISFDTSIEEIFPALLRGARVVMRPEHVPGTRELNAWLEAEGVTVADLPTAFWHEWVGGMTEGGLPLPASLRAVVIGGERATGAAWRAWARISPPGVRLLNTYGPTEACVTATVAELGAPDGEDPPIGIPLPYVTAVILGEDGQPAPPGAPGELCLGGPGLARGYHGLPALTAERFIPAPAGVEIPGADPRLYRTGDLAALGDDGALRFIGRVDDQVKVRGFRIELGEIARTLEAHPAVLEAVITVSDGGGGRLTAHVLPAGAAPGPAQLMAFLTERLPPWMFPAEVRVVERLPRTPGGKVDRRALAAASPAPHAPRGSAAPRGHVEATLLRIWREVFERPDLGTDDGFFELGGHSLLALRLVDRAHQAGLGMRPEDLLRFPTVAALAPHLSLDALQGAGGDRTLVALRPGGSRPPLVLVHSTPGDLLGYLDLVRVLGPDQPVYGLQSRGLVDPAAAHTSIPAMGAHYAHRLREAFPGGPHLLCGWCFGGSVALEIARNLKAVGEPVALLALIDTWPQPSLAEHPAHHLRRVKEAAQAARSQGLGFVIDRLKARRDGRARQAEEDAVMAASGGPLRHRALVHRVNTAAILAYETRPYPGEATLFAARITPPGKVPVAPDLWAPFLTGMRAHLLPGDHTGILRPPSVDTLAALMRAEIDAARS